MFSTTHIVFAVSAFLLVLILQGFLSSRKNMIFGLFLPICWFAFSIYVIVHFKNFIGNHGLEGYQVWGWYAMQIFIGNLPTFILLLIFSMCRPKKNDSLDEIEE